MFLTDFKKEAVGLSWSYRPQWICELLALSQSTCPRVKPTELPWELPRLHGGKTGKKIPLH